MSHKNTFDRVDTDPGMTVVSYAQDQTHMLLDKITGGATTELTIFRDHIDDLMRAIQRKKETIAADITDLAQFTADCVGLKVIAADAVQRLIERLPPPAPPTITQTNGHKGNGQHR